MSSECDKCGLEDADCHCYLHELGERICLLEEGLDELTKTVKNISDYLRKEEE